MPTPLFLFRALWRMPLLLALVAAIVPGPARGAARATPQSSPRTSGLAGEQRDVFGTVTDGREPLRNAVVELKNPASNRVISFLTAENGQYSFKRLDSHTDYTVSATFRGHHSRTRSISMFDDHLQKKVDLVIRLDK